MSVWCVLLAAGKGSRSGLHENKVFFRWNGKSVLSRCMDALCAAKAYDGIVLVLAENDLPAYEALTAREGSCPLVKKVVTGGATRRESGLNGLKAVPEDCEIVAVHDAARPFVSVEVIRATIADARAYGSGVISTPVVDTIKQLDAAGNVTTPERSMLRAVQTPQTFDYKKLMAAHVKAEREGWEVTDDAMLFEREYGCVHLSCAEGAEKNIKLTNPDDFEKLAGKPALPRLRVGSGYDAHRLKEGRKLILCGVEVPHDRGLDGHSDADVAVHALMDALIGAIGEGDIGKHFPDSDPAYKGISSMLLLEHVMQLIQSRGFAVINADVTIVAQKPKLAAHIPVMKQNLIRALGTENVNVKATTTERMGFEGEEIGISAQSVVLLGGI